LLGLSQLNFENISKRKKANMRKKTYNNNYITLGFEPGFTRQLAMAAQMLKNTKSTKNTDLLLKNEQNVSKKKQKKKVKAVTKKKK
jgi:hypothetical protein